MRVAEETGGQVSPLNKHSEAPATPRDLEVQVRADASNSTSSAPAV